LSSLAEVARKARTLGLAQLARDAEAAGFAAGQVPVTEGVFARDGAMWTLSYGGVTARMRDAKGLSDLAVLLAAPGRQVPAADLIAAAGAGQAGLAACGWAPTRCSTRPHGGRSGRGWPAWARTSRRRRAGTTPNGPPGPGPNGTRCCAR